MAEGVMADHEAIFTGRCKKRSRAFEFGYCAHEERSERGRCGIGV